MGFSGRMMNEVLISRVTTPAALAAGRELVVGKGLGAPPPKAGEEENVLTVLTSVLMGKLLITSM
jgi:hypothetical protein